MASNFAIQFGFKAGNGTAGQGDGNGLLDIGNPVTYMGPDDGEAAVFWIHLSQAGLIDGTSTLQHGWPGPIILPPPLILYISRRRNSETAIMYLLTIITPSTGSAFPEFQRYGLLGIIALPMP